MNLKKLATLTTRRKARKFFESIGYHQCNAIQGITHSLDKALTADSVIYVTKDLSNPYFFEVVYYANKPLQFLRSKPTMQITMKSLLQARDRNPENPDSWSNIGHDYLTEVEHFRFSFLGHRSTWTPLIDFVRGDTASRLISMGQRIYNSPQEAKQGQVFHFLEVKAPLTVYSL